VFSNHQQRTNVSEVSEYKKGFSVLRQIARDCNVQYRQLALKDRAWEMINAFIKLSVNAGLKTLIVGPKVFQEMAELEPLWTIQA